MKTPRGWPASLILLLALAQPGTPVLAAPPTDAPAARPASKFTFSLLPKSLQRRPSVDFHVVTELTSEGRKLAPPSSAEPVYYIAQPGQFTQLGDNTPAGENPPDIERLTRAMEAALASSGYRPASPTSPLPALAVVFNYGSFARFSMAMYDVQDDLALAEAGVTDGPLLRSEERDVNALLPVLLSSKRERDEVLRRAALVGGEKFSRDLAKVLAEEAVYRTGDESLRDLGFSTNKGAGPFQLFRNANENSMLLVEDSFNSCYFVIASAFDYRAMRAGQKVLLWRTKMTVNDSGISMSESLPVLVAAAGPYLGREMPDAVTLTRQINRSGRIKLDELQVLELGVPVSGDKAR
jgi:hypothetical protein